MVDNFNFLFFLCSNAVIEISFSDLCLHIYRAIHWAVLVDWLYYVAFGDTCYLYSAFGDRATARRDASDVGTVCGARGFLYLMWMDTNPSTVYAH